MENNSKSHTVVVKMSGSLKAKLMAPAAGIVSNGLSSSSGGVVYTAPFIAMQSANSKLGLSSTTSSSSAQQFKSYQQAPPSTELTHLLENSARLARDTEDVGTAFS
jgi:hypothetical protein